MTINTNTLEAEAVDAATVNSTAIVSLTSWTRVTYNREGFPVCCPRKGPLPCPSKNQTL